MEFHNLVFKTRNVVGFENELLKAMENDVDSTKWMNHHSVY